MVEVRVTDPNFIDVTRAINESGVPYFIGGGTLLRLHRDGDLAPETRDIDICFRGPDIDQGRLVRILTALGFQVEYSDVQNVHAIREGGRRIDLNFYTSEIRVTSDGTSSPHEVIAWCVIPRRGLLGAVHYHWHKVSIIVNGERELRGRCRLTFFRIFSPLLTPFLGRILSVDNLLKERLSRTVEYRIPSNLLDTHLVVSEFASWYQPIRVEAVLESLYGTDWRTPSRREEWFGFAKNSPM
jgi:hypothetical protein